MGQLGFFDVQNRLEEISQCGDPLERLNDRIEWTIFWPLLRKAFKKDRKSPAGRVPFDYLKMFKVIILQRLNSVSDEQMEFLMKDRLSYSRFAAFGVEEGIPDQKTIWLFKEHLREAGIIERLFALFENYLGEHGLRAQKGQIIDATIIEVPVQRNTREENAQIKSGEKPAEWSAEPDKERQKDVDARWTEKHGKQYFGYKNHVNVDVKHKLIRKYGVTPANVHDSQVFEEILDPYNTKQSVWADSAYRSEEAEETLADLQVKSQVHEKGYRNKPLSDFQGRLNTKKSKIRARVEHVFGFMANTMRSKMIRGIGLRRAEFKIGLMNLVYNLCRYEQIMRMAEA